MSVFVDTSALIALLDHDESRHEAVLAAWLRGVESGSFVTTNYVIVESSAVAQRRLGMEAVRALHERLQPVMEVLFLGAEEHATATGAFLAAGRRGLSLVDCASFEVMRRRGIRDVLTLDADFGRQGFRVLPTA